MKLATIVFFLIFNTLSGYAQRMDSIIVGNGGGFSGQIIAYKIVKNVLFKGKGLDVIRYEKVDSKKSKNFKAISKDSGKLFASKQSFDRPSNVYYFIELYSKGKKTKYVWGDPSFQTPEDVKSLYTRIMNQIKIK